MTPSTVTDFFMTEGLTLEDCEAASRKGCIGMVWRLIRARPWLTAGEIAEALQEAGRSPCGVSDALNRLKHEGRALREKRLGRCSRDVWAATSNGHTGAGAERLHQLQTAAGLVQEPLDWRANESTGEDAYAR